VSKKTSKDTPGFGPLTILGVIAALVLAGLIYYAKFGPSPTYDPKNPPDVNAEKGNGEKEMGVTYDAAVYRNGKLVIEKRTAPAGTDPVVASVNSVLESIPAVPPEARLQETKRDGDTMKLKFTSNFTQTYGNDDESNVITGVMKAVSANSDVKFVVFETVNGSPIETLGNADLVGPQSVRDWIGG
jgi:hypothetical protein